jgi:hypothetical protein
MGLVVYYSIVYYSKHELRIARKSPLYYCTLGIKHGCQIHELNGQMAKSSVSVTIYTLLVLSHHPVESWRMYDA